MRSFVSLVIEFYMFICVALLLFNVLYIFRAKILGRIRGTREEQWLNEVWKESERIAAGNALSPVHVRRLERKLCRIESLMAYHNAVLTAKERDQEQLQTYLDTYYPVFQLLAAKYGKRSAMERAFYAHVMSIYHPGRDGRNCGQLIEVLLTYLEDSTVFCRENVLQAFCAFGSAGAVERAFHLMNQNGWYHHSRLLSDGLMRFKGDREALCRQLWNKSRAWEDSFQVAVVQMATNLSDGFAEEFLSALQDPGCPLETRFALVRYFQRRRYEPAWPVLVRFLERADDGGLAIAAAAALGNYPGRDTRAILMDAMHSRNWYVRKNAAGSLIALGAGEAELAELRGKGDRYAAEMLEYVLEKNAQKEPSREKETQVLAAGVSG